MLSTILISSRRGPLFCASQINQEKNRQRVWYSRLKHGALLSKHAGKIQMETKICRPEMKRKIQENQKQRKIESRLHVDIIWTKSSFNFLSCGVTIDEGGKERVI